MPQMEDAQCCRTLCAIPEENTSECGGKWKCVPLGRKVLLLSGGFSRTPAQLNEATPAAPSVCPKVMGLPSSEGQLMDDLPHAVKRIPVDFWAAYAAGSRA